MFDQTSFAKFLMVGRDAEAALSWICANDVAKAPGSLTYTQMLNARGGIECDLTVARIAEDRFYIVTGTGFATHDFHWIERNIPAGLDARLIDITSHNGAFADGPAPATCSPHSARIRSPATMSRTRFPFGACRTSPSPARRCWRSASPMSASLAGSCMSRSSSPRLSTTG